MPDAATIAAIAGLFSAMNGWTVGTVLVFIFLVFVILPIILMRSLVQSFIKLRDEVRGALTEQRTFYNNNVELVNDYHELSRDLATMVRVNTEASTRLAELLKTFLQRGR
ncbi:MAG: hypothetical protein ACD_75C01318G0007 [uncultured bacterium]|nr:MAG: hypothetical protein ACD_75C01318G0007 [uncultured bacterium]